MNDTAPTVSPRTDPLEAATGPVPGLILVDGGDAGLCADGVCAVPQAGK